MISFIERTWFLAILLIVGLANGSKSDDKGCPKALLIAAEKYRKVTPLEFAANDARRLAETLVNRCGYGPNDVQTIVDENADQGMQPIKRSVVAQLDAVLSQAKPDDRLLLFFSGHGVRDHAGSLYLCPVDADPADIAGTCIPAASVREKLNACPAAFKLLVLDVCHAGEEKETSEGISTIPAKDLAEGFKGAIGVVTIASSTAEEKSRMWPFKQQSLFSYWVSEALKGHADANADAKIDVDELYQYVYSHVSQTAKVRMGTTQTPVRILGSRVPGKPIAATLAPQSLSQTIADMAEILSSVMEERQIPKVGVLEFGAATAEGDVLGADFGALGRWCGDELRTKLQDRSAGRYAILDRAKIQHAAQQVAFKTSDLESDHRLKAFSKSAGDLPALAVGTLRGRHGRVVALRCRLKECKGDDSLAEVGGVAQLSEREWATLGRSAEIRPADRRPEIGPGNRLQRPVTDRVVERLDQRSTEPHPMQSPNCPYRITIQVKGKDRKPVFVENDAFVMLRKGEEFEILLESRESKSAMVRLLVDGLDTLPHRSLNKAIAEWEVGPPSTIESARSWYLDPKAAGRSLDGRAVWSVNGFVSVTGERGKVRKFTVVDAENALASRKNYADNIGLISAAFFSAERGTGERSAIGVDTGTEVDANLKEHEGLRTGNMSAVLHLRYVDEATFTSIRP